MNDLVSIIIPAYNCEKTIIRCLSSINKQDYGNYEVIIINDGSTDFTELIINRFIMNKEKFIYYYQKNRGPSFARNTGIRLATGDFFIFIDSDDIIPPNYISSLMKNSADLVICDIKRVGDDKEYEHSLNRALTLSINEFLNTISIFMDQSLVQGPCNKLFKKSIIVKNKLKFNNNYTLGEDTLFVYDYLSNCQNIKYTNDTYYIYYNQSEDSLSLKYRSDRYKIFLALNNRLEDLLKKKGLDYTLTKRLNSNDLNQSIRIIFLASNNYYQFKKLIENDITPYFDMENNKDRRKYINCMHYLLKKNQIFIYYVICILKYNKWFYRVTK